MYIPSGQCPSCRKDAYSSDTSVKVSGLVCMLLLVEGILDGGADAEGLLGLDKSIVCERAGVPSIVGRREQRQASDAIGPSPRCLPLFRLTSVSSCPGVLRFPNMGFWNYSTSISFFRASLVV